LEWHRPTAAIPSDQRLARRLGRGTAGTKRVHQYPRTRTVVRNDMTESPASTGASRPLAPHEIHPALDRTQEVAGSSPASSTSKGAAVLKSTACD
jgi:hypothetical protein